MRLAPAAVLLAMAAVAGCGASVHVQSRSPLHPPSAVRAEIAAARASDPGLFAIFPRLPGTEPCAIPAGGIGSATLQGTCRTRVWYPNTHGHGEARVLFRESWGSGHFSSWTLWEELPTRKVLVTKLHGEPAPQMRDAASDRVPRRRLAGEVLVVATPDGRARICGDQGSDLMFGPPACLGGPRAVGIRPETLQDHSSKPAERWGYPYLVGYYRDGTFYVTLQRLHSPRAPSHDVFATPPCAPPSGGWRLVTPTDVQRRTVDHYSQLAHHHDLVDIAFFHHGAVLTVASSHPARTRAVLGRYWPRQLCVVRARYSRATLIREGKRMVALLKRPSSAAAAAYGWPNAAGGTTVNSHGQPMTNLDVLLVTPKLRAYLRKQPPGLIEVQATLRPVG